VAPEPEAPPTDTETLETVERELLEDLRGEQAKAEEAAAALEDRLRRALADLDNLRKRYARELERERIADRVRVLSEWLPVVDNLERALVHADGDAGPLVQGVQAVWAQAMAALARLGFDRFEDVGQPFDPERHEAVGAAAASDVPPATVVSAVRPGYASSDIVLRPAAVVVSKSADR
jgi:molecular chaperone GrpE